MPYYLSGVKLSIPISSKLNFYGYLLNGWQNIRETNDGKSVGTQLEYKPSAKWLINWNTYVGDERSEVNPANRTRYFGDLYVLYNTEGKFSATACFYLGAQQRVDSIQRNKEYKQWYTINTMARYRVTPQFSLSARIEYFNDPGQVQITPVTNVEGFRTYSTSLCLSYAPTEAILMRMEARSFFSNQDVYQTREAIPTSKNGLAIASIAVSF